MNRFLLLVFILSSTLFSKEYTLDLDKSIDMALENNALNRISKLNLDVAKAQYEQALSANYPSIDAILYANRDKNDTVFQQRGEFVLTPDLAYLLQKSSIPLYIDPIAKGRDTIRGQVEVNYPLYTGGKISAIIEQARLNKEIKEEAIIRENKCYF